MSSNPPTSHDFYRRVAHRVAGCSVVLIVLLVLGQHGRTPAGPDKWARARDALTQTMGPPVAEDTAPPVSEDSRSRDDVWAEKDQMAHDLAYVSNGPAAERLGCPIDHSMACFYHFRSDMPKLLPPENRSMVALEDCTAVFKPLPSDRGRPWCIRQGSEPKWLQDAIPHEQRSRVEGPVLLTGHLDGPNPTHQANLHFHAIWRWMKRHKLLAGMLHMIVDSSDTAWAPGRFGAGLATALGRVEWLPLLKSGLYTFGTLQFSIPDGELFPFDLEHLAIDGYVDVDYLELAESVKTRAICELSKLDSWPLPCKAKIDSQKPKVVLSRRKDAESRVWENVDNLAAELDVGGELDVQVVTFGNLTFLEQVQTAAGADVLVGITGSDLVNLMFLPLTGSVVEIFPAMKHETVFVPELANMAKMLGKNHFTYVSAGNVTFDEAETKLLFKTKSIDVAVTDLAALVRYAVHQSRHGSFLQSFGCTYNGLVVQCRSTFA